jgi:hypothetical protein
VTPEQLLALVSGRSLPLAEPVGGAAPAWTLVECGFCAAGLTPEQAAAFWWRYAHDPTAHGQLLRALRLEVERIAAAERWPERVDGRAYIDELVALALAEDVLSDLDRHRLRERLPREWPPGAWQRHLARRYARVGAVLDAWCADAHRHMAARMRDDDDS